jgi:NDP-sugar pyrophosphorylase family protein
MKPYSDTYQKTMIPVHGKPLLEYIVDGLIYAGIKDIIIVVGYQKEQIIDYFQDGSKWGIQIEYLEQKTVNGTGGAVLLCETLIKKSHFFLTWGDILVPYSVYKSVVDVFYKDNEDFILVTNYLDELQKGCSVICDENYCISMVEKPPPGMEPSNLNNCGIFILDRRIFEELRNLELSERGEIELPEAICRGIDDHNWKVRVVKMEKSQFRGDFGDLKEYEQLKKETDWLKEL